MHISDTYLIVLQVRLVQNAGEFVITFPRAYHMGFSHGKTPFNHLMLLFMNMNLLMLISIYLNFCYKGFNCAEAANIATPEWLNIAYDAAVRRASINYPPMVSHFQLLYDLAIALSRSRYVFGHFVEEASLWGSVDCAFLFRRSGRLPFSDLSSFLNLFVKLTMDF